MSLRNDLNAAIFSTSLFCSLLCVGVDIAFGDMWFLFSKHQRDNTLTFSKICKREVERIEQRDEQKYEALREN